jgi:surfeit locus 1 family protein
VWRDLRRLVAPRVLVLHALGLLATCIAVWLGLWQVDVWQAHREAEARDLSTMAPVPVEDVLGPDQPFPSDAVGRPVELEGRWLPDATFYVTGRELDGRAGTWAVTPVAVCPAGDCAGSAALLVVRGFTEDPATAPAPPEGAVDLTGWLQPPEGTGRPDPDPRDDRLPELRIADAIQRVDQDLYSAYLVGEQAEPAVGLAGLEPVTPSSLPDPGGDSGLRNVLYGIQWWLFAAFAVYVWWRWVRDELERQRQAESVAAADTEAENGANEPGVPSEP